MATHYKGLEEAPVQLSMNGGRIFKHQYRFAYRVYLTVGSQNSLCCSCNSVIVRASDEISGHTMCLKFLMVPDEDPVGLG